MNRHLKLVGVIASAYAQIAALMFAVQLGYAWIDGDLIRQGSLNTEVLKGAAIVCAVVGGFCVLVMVVLIVLPILLSARSER